ncbi:DNA repair protein RadA [Thermoactinomyces intermedius]|uniref:DNA repair protein RadA n=1 Tax=Thermoactinomyces intermedius TaxID=2024 RepID=A0A8I1A9W4_THEIN|nr:DNA repair protein RadA [Thermoactinomyces intermedius]MBA4549344.1 DNA repair protein RadA [Thermoactinomyces intermedius]MBA4837267.1 DNA repair protein RadA [Thermoactinomyces intermedius]MBH8595625.1 DNA repair protein RadA [Thermoactinomyces intermedius]
MAKKKTKFVCQECGYETPKWMGRCPGCHEWNTMVEELNSESSTVPGTGMHRKSKREKAIPITQVEKLDQPRSDTGIRELNRVLGGGLVPGSFVLVGGDPGIGKSTLLLQATHELAKRGLSVLYVSGEESAEQIRLRADRLDALSERLLVVSETDLTAVELLMDEVRPKLMVIDSIQTMFHPDIASAPGSVAQVRECTGQLMRWAKEQNITIIIVGHVTKSGSLAGPRMLEHMVDCVLYFEGERHHTYRVLRAVKNRFGSTNEIGVFEMKEEGLAEVENPSELFLSGRPVGAPGTAVTASMEGTRPVLVELQALVAPTSFATPKRMAAGIDYNRVTMIMAVLEKRLGLFLQNYDAYINVVGGVRIDEPAVDLSVAVSLASSFRDVAVSPFDLFIGEVGLTGEVRGVSRIEQRVAEAHNMGFKRVILPEKNGQGWTPPKGIELIGVNTLEEALEVALGG